LIGSIASTSDPRFQIFPFPLSSRRSPQRRPPFCIAVESCLCIPTFWSSRFTPPIRVQSLVFEVFFLPFSSFSRFHVPPLLDRFETFTPFSSGTHLASRHQVSLPFNTALYVWCLYGIRSPSLRHDSPLRRRCFLKFGEREGPQRFREHAPRASDEHLSSPALPVLPPPEILVKIDLFSALKR